MSDASDPHSLAQIEVVDAVVVDAVFAGRGELATRFVGHLASTGVEWGLIGPREVPRLWTRHVLNCAVLGELVAQGASVLDVGSGAGLPGLAVAIARPDLRVILVEPLERRTAWLSMVVDDLGLDVEVVRARAEEVRGTHATDVVTARAVAALDKLARWTVPLTVPGGQVLAIKGRSAADEVAAASKAFRRLGVVGHEVVRCGEAVLEQPTTVVRLTTGPQRRRP
ncbi:16S rRNA (guanine(527)-N(7))-methyltransferase RsmG [Angustibacter speluncae]